MNQQGIHNAVQKALVSMASKPMFIHRGYAKDLLLQFDARIASVGSNEVLAKEQLERQKEKTAIRFYSASKSVTSVARSGRIDKDIPKGSIAVVPVYGAMMRDDYCTMAEGDVMGTRSLESIMSELENNENVDGVVFRVNTPGGEALGNESLSRAIKNFSKPTVTHFDMMASAGVFAFQGADEVYGSERNALWGSIGTYISLADDKEFWNNVGVEWMDIYASESTEKNMPFREAIDNGNKQPMIEFLDSLNKNFISEVKNSTPNLKDDGHVFKGKLYTAAEARKIGAIDGIKSLDFAIERARYLSRNPDKRKGKNKSNVKNQFELDMSNQEKQAGFFQRFFGANTSVEEAENKIEAANQEVAKMEEANTKLNATVKEQNEKISALEKENEALKASVGQLEEKSNSLEASNKELSEKVTSLEESASEMETKNKELEEANTNLENHNKELGAADDAQLPTDTENSVSHKNPSANLGQKDSFEDILNRMQERKEKNKK